MKPTLTSFKKILSHSKLIYTDMISLQSVELNGFISDEDLACNRVLRSKRWVAEKGLTAGGACGGAPGAGGLWLVERSCSYFHHTCSSAHPVKEGVAGCNPDMAWRWHSRIHYTHLSFYFEHLRVTVDFSTLCPFRTVRSWTWQWRCHSCNTSNMC